MNTAEFDILRVLAVHGVQTNSKRAEKIRSLLPVGFSAEDLHYIAVKSMAQFGIVRGKLIRVQVSLQT